MASLATLFAGDGLTASSSVMAVNVDDSTIETNSDAVRLKDNGVTHDKLENRYTASAAVGGTTGAQSIDWSAACIFTMPGSLTGAIEFDFTNYKKGQVITIIGLTGSQTITLDSDAGSSETFNKLSEVDYDGSATNQIQIECIDDDATAIFNYVVSTYTSDTTP